MALGAFYFSLMTLFVKLVGARLPNQEVVLVRGVFTLLFTWALLRRAGVPVLGNRRGVLLLRGLFGFGGLSCFYYAVVHLPLAEATVLQYMNPLWAALFGAIFLAERMARREVLLVALAMMGVILIARPAILFGGGTAALDGVAVGAGLLGAALSGAAYVTVRELSRTEHPLVIVFYFPLVTVPAALPGALSNIVVPTAREWLLLLAMAVAAQLGQIHFTRGLRREPAGRATAIGYLQVVFAGLWGLLFFAELPDAWSVAGSVVILGSMLLLAFGGVSAQRKNSAGSADDSASGD